MLLDLIVSSRIYICFDMDLIVHLGGFCQKHCIIILWIWYGCSNRVHRPGVVLLPGGGPGARSPSLLGGWGASQGCKVYGKEWAGRCISEPGNLVVYIEGSASYHSWLHSWVVGGHCRTCFGLGHDDLGWQILRDRFWIYWSSKLRQVWLVELLRLGVSPVALFWFAILVLSDFFAMLFSALIP